MSTGGLFDEPDDEVEPPVKLPPVVDTGAALAALQTYADSAGVSLSDALQELLFQLHVRCRRDKTLMAAGRRVFGVFYNPIYRVVLPPEHMLRPVEGEAHDRPRPD